MEKGSKINRTIKSLCITELLNAEESITVTWRYCQSESLGRGSLRHILKNKGVGGYLRIYNAQRSPIFSCFIRFFVNEDRW